jgi:ApaG protein
MSLPITQKINVHVKSTFSELQSNIELNEYFFTYHILIENLSNETVQLLSRKWQITDSNGETRFVEGEGVVGEQPIIEADHQYEYYSGCLLKTGFGKMKGSYVFQRVEDNYQFEVEIPEFHMILPWVLN